MKNNDSSVSNKKAYQKDYDLVQRALDGDSSAANQIVEKHQKNVYNLGLRLGGNKEEAECILQDTFLKVFEKLSLFRGESQLGTWIHRVATNVALMRIRGRKGKFFLTIEEELRDKDLDSRQMPYIAKSLDRTPLDLTMDEELRQKLEEAIYSLPVNLRTAFVLKDIEGLSMADIAERTEKSISAVKADLHRARVKLRKRLVDFVGDRNDG